MADRVHRSHSSTPKGLFRAHWALHTIGPLPPAIIHPSSARMTPKVDQLHTPRLPGRRAAGGRPCAHERGQALVEFAAVLLPLLLIVVGIVQFGFLFGANVTLTNAAREAARAA